MTASVSAPHSRAADSESTRSGDLPDWLTAMNSTSSSCGRARYTVKVDGDTKPAGSPSFVSTRYFAYSAAWSLVPRAARRTNRGRRRASVVPTSTISAARTARAANRAGCSRTSARINVPGSASTESPFRSASGALDAPLDTR